MPYDSNNPKSLPKNVQEMSPNKRKKWVAIWNSTYSQCVKDGGEKDDCETKAFKTANGTVKKMK